MGAYERWLRDSLPRRAWIFGMRGARFLVRRMARLFGSHAVLRARAVARALDQARVAGDTLEAKGWVLAAPVRVGASSTPPKVVHVIGSLAAGGAERQLALHTVTSKRLGLASPTIVTLNACIGEGAHYSAMVSEHGVEIRHAGAVGNASVRSQLRTDLELHRRLCAIPLALRPYATDLAGEFLYLQPDVVHAWLDHANICAAVSALAVGVPRIVLTFRSLNPSHFPAWYQPWMLPAYQVLARSPRVKFIANSSAGAQDYAAWIGIDPTRIEVVRNGLDLAMLETSDASHTALRASLCAPDELLVAGVFRLGDEKQPLLFAAVAQRVIKRLPQARFVVAGDGPMREELRRATRALGNAFQLLGRREDAHAILGAADVALLTSRVEGTPNVLIEAQAAGTPVVATAVGGIPDTVRDGCTGLLAPAGDADALASNVIRLLEDAALRTHMSHAARLFVREEFSLERMTRAMAHSYQ